jgi:hypothetical protein
MTTEPYMSETDKNKPVTGLDAKPCRLSDVGSTGAPTVLCVQQVTGTAMLCAEFTVVLQYGCYVLFLPSSAAW